MILASGMKDWSPSEWGVFFGAIAVLITGTVAPFLWTLFAKASALAVQIKEAKEAAHGANTTATSASIVAAVADAKADGATKSVSENTTRIVNLAATMPPPTVEPPSVTVEAVAAALASQPPGTQKP